ncbi:MAG: hypothetical protein WC488_02580 [Candidatus Micrarchaeia archaeon]
MPKTDISDKEFLEVCRKQSEWVGQNFLQNLKDGLETLGFGRELAERNKERISNRISAMLADVRVSGVASGEDYGHLEQGGEAVALDKKRLFEAAGCNKTDLGMGVRDELAHQAMHALQPGWAREEFGQLPLSLHEGGAEAFSNLVLRSTCGKITHPERLVLLAAVFSAPASAGSTLKKDLAAYNLAGFMHSCENAVGRNEIGGIVARFRAIEQHITSILGAEMTAKKLLNGNYLSQEGLKFLAEVTYAKGINDATRKENAKANVIAMLDAKLERLGARRNR